MTQIPLPPFDVPPEPPNAFTTSTPRRKRLAIFGLTFRGIGWLGSSPIHWMGIKSIRQGATFIGGLAQRARTRSVRDPRFRTAELGSFDLQATAFSMGMPLYQLERHLAARRRQTALTAYLFGVFGAVFLIVWFLKVFATPLVGGRLVLAIDFLPPCLLFVLLAFYQALVNFQIRTGRTAGWREYLTTEEGFWPRA